MIIRNPYNFIVKYYKLINIILIIPMIYLAINFNSIAKFFSTYISSGYTTPETNFADVYVNGLMYFVVIIMLIVNAGLYFIFSLKKKNNAIFLISSLYYVILLVFLVLFHSSMSAIEKDTLSSTFANFVRDCAIICYIPLYLLMLINFGRGVGFNYRTLRFDSNPELKITDEDAEDIEIKIGSEDKSFKKSTVHTIRELKYYISENRLIFKWIGIILLFIVGYTTISNLTSNKTFSSNQAFKLQNITLTLKESYITNTDTRGIMLEDGKYYIAVKMGIQNTSKTEPVKIDKSLFRIYSGNTEFYPLYDKSSRFLDIGETYQGEEIKPGEAHDYVFVYELTKNQVKSKYQMRILNSYNEKNGKLEKKYRKITIRPANITKVENLGKARTYDIIKFDQTTLQKTTLKIKNISLAQSYAYEYEICNLKNECSIAKDTLLPAGGKLLLIIEDELNIDESIPYAKYNGKDLYVDFGSINYRYINNTNPEEETPIKSTYLKNVTPKAIKDKKIYEVSGILSNSKDLELVLRIRNKYITIDIDSIS